MYQDILDRIDVAIATFVIDLFTALSSELESTLRLMMILSIILYGLAMTNGWIETSLKDAMKHIFMGIVFYIFATNVGLFSTVLFEMFTNGPAHLLAEVLRSVSSGSGSGSINTFISDFYDKGIRVSGDLMYGSGWSVSLKFMGFAVAAAVIGLCGYSAFLVCMSKIAVAVLLGLSPIFIACLFFKTTRGLFEGWLRQLFNFALIPLLTYTVMLFCLAIVTEPSNLLADSQANGNLTSVVVWPYVFSCVVSFLLLMQVMGIAGGIAGGVSLSTMGVVANRFSKHSVMSLQSMRGINLKIPKFGKNSISN